AAGQADSARGAASGPLHPEVQVVVIWRAVFGPPPPPLGGGGGGGGERAHLNPVACPLPVPPPQAGEGTMWRQHEALPRREPDEPACAAYFPLTRVTRIFQKSVLTKIASAGTGGTALPAFLLPARGRRRAGVPNATFRCRKRLPAQFHCFRIVIYNGRCNARVCRRPGPGAQR